jgi:hypothetical protein
MPVSPQPKSNAAPLTAMPTPVQNAAAMFGEAADDLEETFAEQAQEIVDEAGFLALAPCDRLALIADEQPGTITELRSFGALLGQVAAQDQVLQRPRPQYMLNQMASALANLDAQLLFCRVSL